MAENKKENDTLDFLTVHMRDGTPISLRRKFIVAALGVSDNSGNHAHSKMLVDDGRKFTTYEIREHANDVSGPFAKFRNLLLNPVYVSGIIKNTSNSAKTHPYRIVLHGPSDWTCNIHTSRGEALVRLQEAARKGPC